MLAPRLSQGFNGRCVVRVHHAVGAWGAEGGGAEEGDKACNELELIDVQVGQLGGPYPRAVNV